MSSQGSHDSHSLHGYYSDSNAMIFGYAVYHNVAGEEVKVSAVFREPYDLVDAQYIGLVTKFVRSVESSPPVGGYVADYDDDEMNMHTY